MMSIWLGHEVLVIEVRSPDTSHLRQLRSLRQSELLHILELESVHVWGEFQGGQMGLPMNSELEM